jgi:glycosyltransferase involved in cell wall biosynthesis
MTIKYLHIVERIDDTYGGPAKSIPLFCDMLRQHGVDNVVLSVNKLEERNEYLEKFQIPWIKSEPMVGLYFSPRFIVDLYRAVKKADIIHLHSCWSFPSLVFVLISSFIPSKKIFFSPRSSLQPKSLDKRYFLKKILRILFIDRFVFNANAVFCSSKYEKDEILEIYPSLKNTQILPNNIDFTFKASCPKESARLDLNLPIGKPILSFVSRIHPRKRLDYLVELWLDLIVKETKEIHLLVVGHVDDKSYFEKIVKKIEGAGKLSLFHYRGSISGAERVKYFAAADLFVLPSEFESFGMAIAESLTVGTPVLVSSSTPWEKINKSNCGWCVELDIFEEKIKEYLSFDENMRARLSQNAREFIESNYSDKSTIDVMLPYLNQVSV